MKIMKNRKPIWKFFKNILLLSSIRRKPFKLENTFNQNVSILILGSIVVQAIPILVMPILTRLYSTSDFGVFAYFTAITAIIGVAITGRLELAINLPKLRSHAELILSTAIWITFFLSLLLSFFVYSFSSEIKYFTLIEDNMVIFYLLPLCAFVLGVRQSFLYMMNREKLFAKIAINNVSQSISSNLSQVIIGFFSLLPFGLIIGQLFGQVISTLYLTKSIMVRKKLYVPSSNYGRLRYILYRYKRFPIYLVPAHGINTIVGFLPIFLLGHNYSTEIVGIYMITHKALAIPVAFIATSVGDVFRQAASEAYATKKECVEIYVSTFKKLLMLAIIPFSIIIISAPYIFPFLFGQEWAAAGRLAQILAPMYFVQFVVSPMSTMFVIAEKQKLDLLWQIIFLFVVTACFTISATYLDWFYAMAIMAVSYIFMYVINGCLTFKMSQGKL